MEKRWHVMFLVIGLLVLVGGTFLLIGLLAGDRT